jgi:hypothetical protein
MESETGKALFGSISQLSDKSKVKASLRLKISLSRDAIPLVEPQVHYILGVDNNFDIKSI